MIGVSVKHEVSALAVARYFSRPHLGEVDLSRHFHSGSTAVSLEPLILLPPGVNPGGIVYAEPDGLVFYALTPERQQHVFAERKARQELFLKLAPLYFRGDTVALSRELNRPSVRGRLLEQGARIEDLYTLQHLDRADSDARGRARAMRAAARQLQLIAPFQPEPFEMSFRDSLRFYESHAPDGKYAGRWEVAMPSPFGAVDTDFAMSMSETHHYIVISRFGGQTLVSDFHRGVRRDYAVEELERDSGAPEYRLAALPAS